MWAGPHFPCVNRAYVYVIERRAVVFKCLTSSTSDDVINDVMLKLRLLFIVL